MLNEPLQENPSDPFAKMWRPSARQFRDYGLALVFALVAVVPHLDVAPAFRSDDILLIAQGHETSPLGGLIRSFVRPFGDTRSIEFYRPLFAWDFCLSSHFLDVDPNSYKIINLFWQAFSVFLGFLLAQRFVGRRAAAFGIFLFALSPWTGNNTAWIAGRSTVVASAAMFGATLLYDRSRIGGKLFSWASLVVLTLGIFYRETTFMASFLMFALDLVQRRKLSWKGYFLSVVPFLFYLGCKFLAVGTFVGGYSQLASVHDRASGAIQFSWQELAIALTRLIGAAPEPFDASLDNLSWAILAISLIAFGFAFRRFSARRILIPTMVIFVVGHGVLLCLGDSVIGAGTAQRWHTVYWGMTLLLGLGFANLPLRMAPVLLLACLATLNTYRLRTHLDDYHRSAYLAEKLRVQVNAATEKNVFVYNLKPYFGAAPLFEIGAGQLSHPPFGKGLKSVYPISSVNSYGLNPRESQTPIAAHLLAQDELASVLWVDFESEDVFDYPRDELDRGLEKISGYPRLDFEAINLNSETGRVLAFQAEGIERIEIHLVCPVAEIRVTRLRGSEEFPAKATSFRETMMDEIVRMGSHMTRGSKTRAWVWVAVYQNANKLEDPIAVSKFVELELRPNRR